MEENDLNRKGFGRKAQERLNPFQDEKEGTQFANKVAFGNSKGSFKQPIENHTPKFGMNIKPMEFGNAKIPRMPTPNWLRKKVKHAGDGHTEKTPNMWDF